MPMNDDGALLGLESAVTRELKPFIVLRWGDQAGQLSPQEARRHALRLLECSEAAVRDAALVKWLMGETFDMSFDQAAAVLLEFRRVRDEEVDPEQT